MSRESVPVAGSDWGSRTASITWTTPLHDSMSAVTTVAEPLSTTFPPLTAMEMSPPWRVVAESSSTTSAAMTVPGTTW
ncbi:MAG: hypothetical protein RL058_204 [Actinomycetota bacterium]